MYTLTPTDIRALMLFAQLYGSFWKLSLRQRWWDNSLHTVDLPESERDVLHRLYNVWGPEGLRKFKLPSEIPNPSPNQANAAKLLALLEKWQQEPEVYDERVAKVLSQMESSESAQQVPPSIHDSARRQAIEDLDIDLDLRLPERRGMLAATAMSRAEGLGYEPGPSLDWAQMLWIRCYIHIMTALRDPAAL